MMKKLSAFILCAFVITLSGCESKSEEPKEEKKEFYEMNEVIKTEFGDYTVTNVTKSQGKEYFGPAEGKEYVIVEIQIHNTTGEEISYNDLDFEVQNGSGVIEKTKYSANDNTTALGSGKLAPDGSKIGTVAFEQAIDDKLILLVKDNMFDSEYDFKVNLK